LPTFSGNYEDRESFKDLFSSLVHNVTSLPDSTKLQYLKSCLVGQAAGLVNNIAVTSANYQSTWQALEIRYYNPRAIIAKLFREFYSITPLHHESAIELRRFTDEVLRIHRAFKNLQVPIESWDLWLLDRLTSNLDVESSKLWEAEQSAKDRRWSEGNSFDSSGSHILDRFPTLSMVRMPNNNQNRKRTLPSTISHPPKRGFHAMQRGNCILCPNRHSLFACREYERKSIEERCAIIRTRNLCFNCLGNHRAPECASSQRCKTCDKRHHTSLISLHQ
jgi:hypothetical protein